jgi:hypothetical protein
LGLAGVSDTLGVASTTQVHQTTGIVNLELSQVHFGRGRFRSVKIADEIDILKALIKNNGLGPGINDEFRTLTQLDLIGSSLNV